MKPSHSLLFVLLLVCLSLPALAQEKEEDPYSDYSYLWEDTKAKEKEAKRKAKEERKREKELEKLRKKGQLPEQTTAPLPADIVKQDTFTQQSQVPADSLQRPAVKSDTIPDAATDSLNIVVDSIQNAPEERVIESSIDSENDNKEEVIKDKKQPVDDFRSGMEGADGGGSFNGGLTFTMIDDQYFAGLVLNPEFKIGKVGLGLNIPILYGLDDKSVRTEIFEDGVGPARLITYLRYGVQKRDPVYVKVGQLNNTMIGFGSLINNYTNTTSFEKRKIGLHFDFNVKGIVGVDGLYSNFNPESMNLLAVRPYLRPLAWSGIPIVNTLEFGATFLKDKDQTSLGVGDSSDTYSFTKEGIGATGFDVGLTLLRAPFIQIDLFANYAKLDVSSQSLKDLLEASYLFSNEPSAMSDGFQDGTGQSIGMNFRFHFIADILSTDFRIERLSYSDHYLPQFFDATYELNKDARIYALGGAEEMSGIYGSFTGHILKKVRLGGNLMLPDNVSETAPATVQLNADVERLANKFTVHASYIKGNLTSLEDTFKFDERSLAKARFIYHLNQFLVVGIDYFWSFTPSADGDYVTTEYVQPYFGVNFDF